jgi:hypothetical protein
MKPAAVPHSMTLEAWLTQARSPFCGQRLPEHLVRQGLIGGRLTGVPCTPTTDSSLSHLSSLHRLKLPALPLWAAYAKLTT